MNSNKTAPQEYCPAVGQGFDYLNSLAPWTGQKGFSTDTMGILMKAFGSPQDKYRSIHVAGTNGKGSVSAFSAAILRSSGAKVGVTTSPHLQAVNERIVIDGEPISDSDLNRLATVLRDKGNELGVTPSFFEGITACAFLAFAERKVDWAVVEVGLGGRLDATNVISAPDIAVITNIDFDHQEILGFSLAEIAREKAGIVKKGSAVVVGTMEDSAAQAIQDRCSSVGLVPYQAGRDFTWNAWNGQCAFYRGPKGEGSFVPALRGRHQLDNAALAITACSLAGIPISICLEGVKMASWPGRIESVRTGALEWLVDCAHNPAGIRTLCNFLVASKAPKAPIIFGVIDTKNWEEMLESLVPHATEFLLVTPKSPKALPTAELSQYLSSIGVKSSEFGSDYDSAIAIAAARAEFAIVTGSIYMIGELRVKLLKLII